MSNKLSIAALIVSVISICCSVIFFFAAGNKDSSKNTEPAAAAAVQQESGTKQYVMYVGTNDKDTYKLEMTEAEAKDIVDRICLKYFPDGYTLQEATGAWTDETNKITHEYTLVCYFDGADIETVHKAADELIEKLNQNSVLIEEDTISIDYYSAG